MWYPWHIAFCERGLTVRGCMSEFNFPTHSHLVKLLVNNFAIGDLNCVMSQTNRNILLKDTIVTDTGYVPLSAYYI